MSDEEEIWLEDCKRSLKRSGLDRLFPVLRQGLYHLTSASGFAGILSDGYIRPNNGSFPSTYEKSAHSYGRSRRYISLFDFETPTSEQCISEEPKWAGFFKRHKPATILIGLDRRKLAPNLISNKRAREEIGFKKMWIPHVEVWYPEPIPFSYTTGLVLITPTRPIEFEIFDPDEEGLQDFDRALKVAEERNIQEEDDAEIMAALLRFNCDK